MTLPTFKLPAMSATGADLLVCPATLGAVYWDTTTRVVVVALSMYIPAHNPARLRKDKNDMSEPQRIVRM